MAAIAEQANDRTAALLQLGRVSTEQRVKALARSLVGTKYFPPGFTAIRQMAYEAAAYHNLRPYPYWQFADWKTEERGPLPRCLPLARRIVTKSAKWLFGRPVQISVPANADLENSLRTAWQLNRMPTHMVHNAERAGYQGGIALKWSYDETDDPKISIQSLSVIDDTRLFWDPHDADRLLMARIQYPVFNPEDGNLYIYREEWTDGEEVHYPLIKADMRNLYRRGDGILPQLIGIVPVIAGSQQEPDEYQWPEPTRKENPFGVIPIWPIRNADGGGNFGLGDLWTDVGGGMFRVLDRINLTFHGMDKSNQFDSERNVVFIDVNAGPDVIDKPLRPGEPISLKTDPTQDGNPVRGQVVELEASGAMRPHMMDYAKELRAEILQTVGSVDVREEEITNKGNLTTAVLTQLYAPLIETTEEKRKTYGEDGIAKFLERLCVGLNNLGVKADGFSAVRVDDPDSFDVQLTWPDYFAMSEDEKTNRITRVDSEVQGGYMPHERALEMVAKTEGVEDVQKFKDELKDVSAAVKERQVKANGPEPDAIEVAEATAKAKGAQNAGGGK